jgi:hypothetical protein
MNAVDINGEKVPVSECQIILRMLYNDAKEIAGVFHGMNRSVKFRINWPDETIFAESEWKSFVSAARSMYAERLGDPKTPKDDARKMHIALVLQASLAKGQETDNRLQLAPNTLQFEGDKFENRKIAETYGLRPNFRAQLRQGAMKLARIH